MVKCTVKSKNKLYVTLGCMNNTVLVPLEPLNVQ